LPKKRRKRKRKKEKGRRERKKSTISLLSDQVAKKEKIKQQKLDITNFWRELLAQKLDKKGGVARKSFRTNR